ncbi:hypothetical protein EV175_000029 [Coemansia sp. RSA 1933]|nr:hypothetical protein EV175_000029 [Coemansia sp. RSA 1933]
MGQTVSKKAGTAAATRKLRLPRTSQQPQQQPESQRTESQTNQPPLLTRDEMLKETEREEEDQQQNQKLADNLKYFLNPKELLTPITPEDPSKNINVQALRSRRKDDDVEVVKANRVKSTQITELLRELEADTSDAGRVGVAAKYGLDKDAVTQLAKYLRPVTTKT